MEIIKIEAPPVPQRITLRKLRSTVIRLVGARGYYADATQGAEGDIVRTDEPCRPEK